MKKLIKIDLGAGRYPSEGYVNLDWYELPGIDVLHNLLDLPWPFGDACATHIRVWDVLEHMPSHAADGHSFPLAFMDEAWRILIPDGELMIHVPDARYPDWATDITHVRPYMPNSFDHLDPDTELGQMFPFYSERKWRIVEREEFNKNITFKLEKRS
jgi:predicted SAM-dependent methyltransferase